MAVGKFVKDVDGRQLRARGETRGLLTVPVSIVLPNCYTALPNLIFPIPEH